MLLDAQSGNPVSQDRINPHYPMGFKKLNVLPKHEVQKKNKRTQETNTRRVLNIFFWLLFFSWVSEGGGVRFS